MSKIDESGERVSNGNGNIRIPVAWLKSAMPLLASILASLGAVGGMNKFMQAETTEQAIRHQIEIEYLKRDVADLKAIVTKWLDEELTDSGGTE